MNSRKCRVEIFVLIAVVTVVIFSSTVPTLALAEGAKGAVATMGEMNGHQGGTSDIIAPVTEWTGVAAIGMVTGLAIPLKTRFDDSSKSRDLIRKTMFTSIAGLSISVGIIHLLLVKEHMEVSYVWGIVFLTMGCSQAVYGIIMIFAKKLPLHTKTLLYKLGIAGNALFVGMFICFRLVAPPFFPDGTPENELQPNGILTVLIQSLLVALLSYLLKDRKTVQRILEEPRSVRYK